MRCAVLHGTSHFFTPKHQQYGQKHPFRRKFANLTIKKYANKFQNIFFCRNFVTIIP